MKNLKLPLFFCFLGTFLACKSSKEPEKEQKFNEIAIEETFLSNPDDFSVKNTQTERKMVQRAIQDEKTTVKVLYKKALVDINTFMKQEAIPEFVLIKDAAVIDSLGIENCDVLLWVK